ncbi:MAG: hypothetical protein QNJ72_43050 [Pleurocapsa sp. MO_226.B13]|nr:hypothetical protein [Pleurocapsa sp. MO_226.B13]
MTVFTGKEYKIRSFSEAEDGHYLVDLDYDAGTWYLWSGHWQLPWEDNREKLEVFTVLGNNIPYLPKITTVPQTWREINWQDFDAKVSKYFSIREVTNGDARRFPQADDIKQNIFTLARELDRVREALVLL